MQTSPHPLAMATMNGSARTGTESSIRSVLRKQKVDMFHKHYPTRICLIADFMCYVHIPPPINVATCYEYFDYFWTVSVDSFVQKLTLAVFVFDKPIFFNPLLEPLFTKKGLRVNQKPAIFNSQFVITL